MATAPDLVPADLVAPDLVAEEKPYYLGTIFLTLFGAGFAYWGVRAFDPSLTAIERPLIVSWLFHLVKDLPPLLRGAIILAIGLALLAMAAVLVRAWVWPQTMLVIDADGIAARNKRLAWSAIGSIEAGKKRIAFLPVDGGAPVKLDPRETTRSFDEIMAAVARYRPDLAAGHNGEA